jgi:hypothetical protein
MLHGFYVIFRCCQNSSEMIPRHSYVGVKLTVSFLGKMISQNEVLRRIFVPEERQLKRAFITCSVHKIFL